MTNFAPPVAGPGLIRRLGRASGAVARALATAVTTVITTALIIFLALQLMPGDPVDRVVGQRATLEQRQAMRERLGLDDPLIVRFLRWLAGAVHGDFGTSLIYRQSVSSLIAPRLATTFLLVVMAALLIVCVGVTVGVIGGVSERWRPMVSAAASLGISVPGFVSATILIGVAAVRLGWFPSFGAGKGFADSLYHLTLPAVALSLSWGAYVTQMTSAAVREQADKEHVATAVGRGLSRPSVIRRHILRNALPPILTVSGLTVAGLVAGSVVVETAFGVDGIGAFLVRSVLNKDGPVVLAISVLIVVVFVAVMTLIDVAQVALDPRARADRGNA